MPFVEILRFLEPGSVESNVGGGYTVVSVDAAGADWLKGELALDGETSSVSALSPG